MHPARWIILSFIIVALLIASGPQTWAASGLAWEEARPHVVQVMDGLYAIIRSFVAGSNPHEDIEDDAPGVNYDIIITQGRAKFF